MKVWVTKYALTKGIQYMDVQQLSRDTVQADTHMYFCKEGKDWHLSYQSALARAEQMRIAKCASIEKQLARLDALIFTDPSEST